MTATATIITSERKGVLLMPNAALRFTPPDMAASNAREMGPPIPGFGRSGGNRNPSGDSPKSPPSAAPANEAKAAGKTGRVWVMENDAPSPVSIQTGESDGTNTEVVEGKLAEGAVVLVDVVTEAK